MSKEIHIKLQLPLTPMAGDLIAVERSSSFVTGTFARLQLGADRFAVEAKDGNVYEVEVLDHGNGRRGSQSWRAVRKLTRQEFETLGCSPVA